MPNCWNFYRFPGNLIGLEEDHGLIGEMIKTLREQLMVELPDFGQHLGYDGKAIDSHSTGQVNRKTGATSDPDANWGKHETHGIDSRELWSEEKQMPNYDASKPITRPLDPNRVDNIIHTEKGQVSCLCPLTREQRDLAFQGFESDRNTLKYRCPAAAYELDCAGRELCYKNAGINVGDFGRIIRIDITEQNRRIFTPTPYGSPSWNRGYNRRSALERINNRIDNNFGFEDHYIRGKDNMTARVGLALAVIMALALGHVKEGREKQMRSLVKPIEALDTG